jgi:rfaE bifunctional protein kinase chain/domain
MNKAARNAIAPDAGYSHERASTGRVLVVGDVMLDRYWFGAVERISPEAPVPVVRIERSEERPGGAANVARNAAALGARTRLLCVVGDDEAGVALERLLSAEHVHADMHRDPTISTTVKLRVSTHGLRSVEHNGGLDNWLVKTSDDKLSLKARRLKREVAKKAVAA